MKTTKNTVFLKLSLAAMIIVSGCGVYNDISSDYDRSADFTKYKTFAWLPDRDTAKSAYNNQIIRNNTRNYFSHCMAARGYKANIDTPDVFLELVITNVKKEETVTSPVYSSYPAYPLYADYYYRNPYYYPYPNPYYYHYPYSYNYATTYITKKVEYTEGSITLNVIDRKLNKLIWTGTAKGDLYDPAYIEDNLHPAVYDILDNYPVKPLQVHRRPKS